MTPDDPKTEAVLVSGQKPQEGLKSAFQKISEEKPQILHEIMAMGFTSGGNPLTQKMNEQHVTQVLNLVTSHDERQFQLTLSGAQSDSKHRTLTTCLEFFGGLVFVGLLVFVIIMFRGQPQLLTPILTGMGGLVGGGLAGYGIGKRKSD
jgi:hypothetical protein